MGKIGFTVIGLQRNNPDLRPGYFFYGILTLIIPLPFPKEFIKSITCVSFNFIKLFSDSGITFFQPFEDVSCPMILMGKQGQAN